MDPLFIVMILIFGTAIGLAMGALGGGGSLLTIPILVYILHMDTHTAVSASLIIVGLNALIGVIIHYRAGHVQIKQSLIFAAYGLIASYVGARLSSLLPGPVLMTIFGGFMLFVALTMIRPRKQPVQTGAQRWWMILLGGAGCGFLTGFLGVGGGFLIVPVLVLFLGMPMRDAVGSSLLIISINSASGLLGHFSSTPLPWNVIMLFSVAGVAGLLAGTYSSKKISAQRLSQSFAVFVLVLAIVVLSLNVPTVWHYYFI